MVLYPWLYPPTYSSLIILADRLTLWLLTLTTTTLTWIVSILGLDVIINYIYPPNRHFIPELPTYPFSNLQSILDVPHTFSFIFVYFYMYLFPISIYAISNPCFYKLAPFGKFYLTDFAFTSSCHTILPNYRKLIPNMSLSPVHNKENFNISTQRNEIHQHLNNRQPLQEITQIITNKPNNESNTTEEIQNTAAPNEIIFLDDILLITDIQQINTWHHSYTFSPQKEEEEHLATEKTKTQLRQLC